MDESRFLSLLTKARRVSSLGERADYWHGYQRGSRRGFLGALFGPKAITRFGCALPTMALTWQVANAGAAIVTD
jgi:hypothetical protein